MRFVAGDGHLVPLLRGSSASGRAIQVDPAVPGRTVLGASPHAPADAVPWEAASIFDAPDDA